MPLPLLPAALGVGEIVAIVGTVATGFWTWMMVNTATDSVETLAYPLIASATQDEPEKDEDEFKNFAGIVSTGLAIAVVFTGYKLLQRVLKAV